MDWMSRRELQIFLTVFLVLGLFIQVFGMNANSRLDLTRSIVERGSFDIDPYRNNTADRSYYNGTYYSNKAPGLSFAATPVYAIWRATYSLFGSAEINETERLVLGTVEGEVISAASNPGGFYLWSLVLLILFSSTLAFGLLCVLVYRFSGVVLGGGWLRLVVVFGFAFGTPLTHYGTQFLPNTLEAFLMFSSFYILYRYDSLSFPHRLFIAGLLGGLAVTVETLEIVVLAALFVYAWHRFDAFPAGFVVGGFIGGLPYMLYNMAAFGAPWHLPPTFLDPFLWPFLADRSGFIIEPVRNFFVSLRLLVFPYRGLFYWSPFLLLSFAGLRGMYQQDRQLFRLIVGVVAAGTLLVSSWWSWWHGGFFGPRHMTFLVPFVFVAVLFGVRWVVDRFWWGGWLVVCLVVVSVGINITGTFGDYENLLMVEPGSNESVVRGLGSAYDKPITTDPAAVQMQEQYFLRLKSFQVLENPILDHYVPGFLRYGPQSRLLSGMYRGEIPPDIRAYGQASPFQIDEDRVPLVLLGWVITGILLLIWRREIQKGVDKIGEGLLNTPS